MAVQQIQVQAGARPAWWRRLSPASFVLAGLTAVIVWAAVASLLGQGRLDAVLGAGRAELRPAAHWPGALLVPLTIVAMDGANWLAHYADHKFDSLWRFHALHHSQEELSVLTSFRAHPLMHTTGFILATIPVVVLMPDRAIAPVLITIYICVGTLQHANLRWTFGPLGRVLVSPAYHRLHHAPDIQTANLGVVFTIWDVVAGWATFPSRRDGVGRTAWTAVRSRSSRAPPGRRPCCWSPASSPSRSRPATDPGRFVITTGWSRSALRRWRR